jgi:hypothetical protein
MHSDICAVLSVSQQLQTLRLCPANLMYRESVFEYLTVTVYIGDGV